MKATYKTKFKGGVSIALGGLGIVLISALSSPNIKATDPIVLGVAFMYLLITVDIIWGNYVTVSDDYLLVVDWFFFRRSVNFAVIARVSYGPKVLGE